MFSLQLETQSHKELVTLILHLNSIRRIDYALGGDSLHREEITLLCRELISKIYIEIRERVAQTAGNAMSVFPVYIVCS